MIYIEMPYSNENDRIDKNFAQKEIQVLNISDDAKYNLFQAIYHRLPRVVSFNDKDSKEISQLLQTLSRLGVPFRQIEEVDR